MEQNEPKAFYLPRVEVGVGVKAHRGDLGLGLEQCELTVVSAHSCSSLRMEGLGIRNCWPGLVPVPRPLGRLCVARLLL